MIDPMERKNGKIWDDYYSICGEEYEMDDDSYSLYESLENKTGYIYKYIWISEPKNSTKYLVKGNDIFYLSENG